MSWIDDILNRCPQELRINDSKTPSGIAHVGSLRGVLIHDALRRAATARGMTARFGYGCDDMDPVDEIPHGTGEHFSEHLGKPLANAPAPPGFDAASMAEAYFGEFTACFEPLGVRAELYRMSEVYASGRLDDTIDSFLRRASEVRAVYARESGAVRDDKWLPFQPICESCGRIGTTYAHDYDGETVAYECRPDLVGWARGCEAWGRISPFGGNGKLPWKLEWAAKWRVLEVGLEGSGKDHMSASGSYDVTSALSREVLRGAVPQVFAYEFFTVGGAKMSSSKGIGVSASEIVATLPPEVLRYLVLRTQPRRALDFELDVASLTKAFTEYERLWRSVSVGQATPKQRQLFAVSSASPAGAAGEAPGYAPPFDSVVSVALQPHIDLGSHVVSLGLAPLNGAERAWLDVKQRTALRWAERFSDPAERLTMAEDLPTAVRDLPNAQRAFLSVSAALLAELDEWTAKRIQATLFDAARVVGLDAGSAFTALYTALFDSHEGPRAGSLLEFTGRDATIRRLEQADYSYRTLAADTAVTADDWQHALLDARSRSLTVSLLPVRLDDEHRSESATGSQAPPARQGVLELFIVDEAGRMTALRTFPELRRRDRCPADAIAGFSEAEALRWAAELSGLPQADLALHRFNPFRRR